MFKRVFVIPPKIDTNDVNIYAVGIDLGTSRCYAAVNRRNGIETVALGNSGERELPSYVSFKENDLKCGQIAIKQLQQNVKSVVFDSKRIIGRNFKDVEKDIIWPFEIVNDQGSAKLQIFCENGVIQKYPEDVAAILLKEIKQRVEEFQGKQLTDVVITAPVTFTEQQIYATYNAAKIAGWTNIILLPEPIAASLAYFIGRPIPNNFKMLLFDFGGGTLDVCIIKVVNNAMNIINIGGKSNLGGRDFDNILFDYFSKVLKERHNIDVNAKHKLKYTLIKNCMEIKHILSKANTASLDVSDFNTTIEDTFIEITRQEFETRSSKLLEEISEALIKIFTATKYTALDINKVLLAGGSCRMPMVKYLLLDSFKKAEHSCEENPDEIVSIGAAYYAYYHNNAPKSANGLINKESDNSLKPYDALNKNIIDPPQIKPSRDVSQSSIKSKNISVVGIDFGNTQCCVAIKNQNLIQIVSLDNSVEQNQLSSYVAYDMKEPKCGREALNGMKTNSKSTIFDLKRIIGKNYKEVEKIRKEIKKEIKWPFFVSNFENKPLLQVAGFHGILSKHPREVVGVLLKRIKQKVDKFEVKEMDEVVMTVPINFDKYQKEEIKSAATFAGWKTLHFLSEPRAAALAYFNDRPVLSKSNILLFDLGGSTLNICIFNIINNKELKIKSNYGDEYLGGRNFDLFLYHYFTKGWEFNYNIKATDSLNYEVIEKCVEIKHLLSAGYEARFAFRNNDHTINKTIRREVFEEMSATLIDRIQETIVITLGNASFMSTDISQVIYAGGGCRMPMIQNFLRKMFPKAEHLCDKNPQEKMAIGAAYYASYLKLQMLPTCSVT